MESILFLIVLGIIYFIPAIVASTRNHNNFMPILALNTFLGLTGFGWIAALIWALSDNIEVSV